MQTQLQAVGMQVNLTQVQQADEINDALAGQYQAVSWRQFAAVDPDLNYLWWSPTEIFGTGPAPIDPNFAQNKDPMIETLLAAGTAVDRPGRPGQGLPADRPTPQQGPALHLERPGHLGHRRQLQRPELQQSDDARRGQGLRHDRGNDLDTPDLDRHLIARAGVRRARPAADGAGSPGPRRCDR